jgi:hypothetical protein
MCGGLLTRQGPSWQMSVVGVGVSEAPLYKRQGSLFQYEFLFLGAVERRSGLAYCR